MTGNDFSTLYAPLIRDGHMEKLYWTPTQEDKIGVYQGIFLANNVNNDDVVRLVDSFPGQSIGMCIGLNFSITPFPTVNF